MKRQPSSTACSYIAYIPDGVYCVNDTLIYSGPVRKVAGVEREYCVWLRFIGQSRRNTIIKLVDNCPGYGDKQNPKPIISFGKKRDVNPMKANNAIKNLTIEEVPFVPWEQDLSKWTTAEGAGEGGRDDSAAIQRAMNDTTKSVFYFPKRTYRIGKTVSIPAHIKVVDFMFSRISGSTPFRVSEDAPDPIHFRDLAKSGSRPRVFIEQDCMRTVYTELVNGRFGNPGNHPGAKAFLCSSNIARADKDYAIQNVDLFWRWGNDEYRDHLFRIGDNCRVVLLG
jgi:hypothetical protein